MKNNIKYLPRFFHSLYNNFFCLPGRYVFDLAFDNVIKVAATCHPSFLQVPEDHHKLLQSSNAPLLINAAEVDQQYPIESQLKGDEILGGGKYKPGYKRMCDVLLLFGFSNSPLTSLFADFGPGLPMVSH